jgi:hypothetical protein
MAGIARLLWAQPASLPLALLATALWACHDTPQAIVGVSPPRAPERSETFTDAGVPEPSPVPDDFRSKMARLGDRFLSEGHARRFEAVIWANPSAAKQWDAPKEMAVGAMLVEETFLAGASADVSGGLLVMEKREEGWHFTLVTAEGDVVSGARLDPCEACHHEAQSGVFALHREAGSSAKP